MKKAYLAPALDINETQASSIIAASLQINNTEVDGSQALSKEAEDWSIWDGE